MSTFVVGHRYYSRMARVAKHPYQAVGISMLAAFLASLAAVLGIGEQTYRLSIGDALLPLVLTAQLLYGAYFILAQDRRICCGPHPACSRAAGVAGLARVRLRLRVCAQRKHGLRATLRRHRRRSAHRAGHRFRAGSGRGPLRSNLAGRSCPLAAIRTALRWTPSFVRAAAGDSLDCAYRFWRSRLH